LCLFIIGKHLIILLINFPGMHADGIPGLNS
jgi:hypothetical protein